VRSKFFKIIVIICILVVITIFYALKQYNKPHANIRVAKPEMVMTSAALIKAFEKDENTATQLYTEKIIQINGVISDMRTSEGISIITLKDNGSESSVICHLESGETFKPLNLQIGQNVTIKGKCSGFLLDVIMIRCVLINERNE